ncbi:MAG TPA: hypothetical protein VMH28_33215 [Candidatus Acidoferrales bacterium]|nr:hypothetical protein [Candidatus Acidoferrales bacterium]
MATKKKAGRAASPLKQDPLVESIMPDPGNLQPTTQLTGWLGKSAQAGSWRLYLTPQLDEYVEFSEADVLHSESIDTAQSPLGGTMVWLNAGTTLQHMQVVRQQVQAGFLSGGITGGYMSAAASSFPVSPRKTTLPPTGTRGYQCSVNPHIPACQPRSEACPSLGCGGSTALCPSGAFVCGASAGCTWGQECSIGC